MSKQPMHTSHNQDMANDRTWSIALDVLVEVCLVGYTALLF
ncbi:hypothetical protein [Fructobacillus ficulneus]|nr:hypothetical protein [Fructobacillus ficulneus]